MKGFKSKIQDADETPFDTTGSEFDPLTVDTVGDALRALDSVTIETLTEFESFTSSSLETTTSDSLVIKTGYPYTSSIKSAGSYIVNHTAIVGQSSNNRESQHTVEWRLGTSGTWTTEVDISRVYTRGGDVEIRSGFFEVTLPTDGVFQLRIRYANPGSGSCTIEEANITIGKVSG